MFSEACTRVCTNLFQLFRYYLYFQVMDEADRILNMDFEKEVRRVYCDALMCAIRSKIPSLSLCFFTNLVPGGSDSS